MQDAQPTIHVHLQRDGGILVLGSIGANFRWFPETLDRLQSTLARAKRQGMVIEYSRDDPEADPSETVEAIYKIIMSYEMPMKLLKDPLLPPP
jgi:hypothetical protein